MSSTTDNAGSPRARKAPPRRRPPPDLPSQLEELLHQVWRSEADWRLDDRIDLALRHTPRPIP